MLRDRRLIHHETNRECVECGAEYVLLADGGDPAECPSCGSRAVTADVGVEVEAAWTDASLQDNQITTVKATDSAGRHWNVAATVPPDDGDARILTVSITEAGVDPESSDAYGFGVAPGMPEWRDELLPGAVWQALADEIGHRPRVEPAGTGWS